MLNKLRIIIREQIRDVFEAISSPHYNDRISDRVDVLKDIPAEKKAEIQNRLNIVNKINFKNITNKTNAKRFGIFISQLNVPQKVSPITTYDFDTNKYYYQFQTKDGKTSVGDQIWAVASGVDNNLLTIMLDKSAITYDTNNYKNRIKVDMIIKNPEKLINPSLNKQ